MKMYLSKGTKRFGIREVEVSQVVGETAWLADGRFMALGKDIHETYEQAVESVRQSNSKEIKRIQTRITRLERQRNKLMMGAPTPITPPPNPNTVLIDVIGAILVNDRDKLAQIYYTLTTQTGG